MKVAVCGCCHGFLDIVYERIRRHDVETGTKTQLLLCCGDFQAVRCSEDMNTLSCPVKYRQCGDFSKYASGDVEAPVLTIFIGGNHEVVRLSQQLFFGGWVAKNIFYLGHSGVIRVGPPGCGLAQTLRIAGLSGIYKGYDFHRGYFERPPFDLTTLKSFCHIRAFDINKLNAIKEPVDVVLTHDWPQGIERYGDWEQLIRRKPFFAREINEKRFGNPSTRQLLFALKPRYWFSAHLHTKFTATIPHSDCETRFVALDKPFPGRREFLHFLDLPAAASKTTQDLEIDKPDSRLVIYLDEEWLSVLSTCHQRFPESSRQYRPEEFHIHSVTDETRQKLRYRITQAQRSLKTTADTNSSSSIDHAPLEQIPILEWPEWSLEIQQRPITQGSFILELIGLPPEHFLSEVYEGGQVERRLPLSSPHYDTSEGHRWKRACCPTDGNISNECITSANASHTFSAEGSSTAEDHLRLGSMPSVFLDQEELEIDIE